VTSVFQLESCLDCNQKIIFYLVYVVHFSSCVWLDLASFSFVALDYSS
jgi:hypothetical protein